MKTIKIYKKKISTDEGEKVVVLKGIRAEIKAVDEGEGIIEAYVSVFNNIDSYGDIMVPGAFKESLEKWFPRYPKGIWAHDWSQPIAKTLEAREDERGLYIKAQIILSVQRGREAWELIKSGVMTDFSFGYEINDYEFNAQGYRLLKRVTIYEWSPVLVGANNQATLIAAKSAGQEPLQEEEVEVPDETPDDMIPVEETETPEVTPPTDPQNPDPENTDTPEGGEKSKDVDVKAGRVLSAKNVDLVKGAIDSIGTAIGALQDVKEGFEALLNAVESTDPDEGDGKGVDQPKITKKEAKNLLVSVRRVANESQKTIVALKKIAND